MLNLCEGILRLVGDFEKNLCSAIGGRAKVLACLFLVSKTPIGMSGYYCDFDETNLIPKTRMVEDYRGNFMQSCLLI